MLYAIQNLQIAGFVREARGIQRHQARIESRRQGGGVSPPPSMNPAGSGKLRYFPQFQVRPWAPSPAPPRPSTKLVDGATNLVATSFTDQHGEEGVPSFGDTSPPSPADTPSANHEQPRDCGANGQVSRQREADHRHLVCQGSYPFPSC